MADIMMADTMMAVCHLPPDLSSHLLVLHMTHSQAHPWALPWVLSNHLLVFHMTHPQAHPWALPLVLSNHLLFRMIRPQVHPWTLPLVLSSPLSVFHMTHLQVHPWALPVVLGSHLPVSHITHPQAHQYLRVFQVAPPEPINLNSPLRASPVAHQLSLKVLRAYHQPLQRQLSSLRQVFQHTTRPQAPQQYRVPQPSNQRPVVQAYRPPERQPPPKRQLLPEHQLDSLSTPLELSSLFQARPEDHQLSLRASRVFKPLP